MSDAHELAARLRQHARTASPREWGYGEEREIAAAAELERLAAELAEAKLLLADSWPWVSASLNAQRRFALLSILKDRYDALLASAGPPQEATFLRQGTTVNPDPPPERRCTCFLGHDLATATTSRNKCPEHGNPPTKRRCTCQRVMLMGREIARPRDPACPEHGR